MVDAELLLDGLDPEQREVATTLDGPLRVLAGAGTGKTRAITSRIAYGVATGAFSAAEVLAVTFTTRAAGELRSRLAELGAAGVQARTFHSAALRQARYFWPQVYGGELPAVVASKLALLGEAAGRNRLKASAAELRDLAAEVEWAKVSNVRPDNYAELAAAANRTVDGYDAAIVATVYATYEDVKRSRQRIDMEDVLLCAAAALSDDERVAAAVRRQYQQFVVDEFQDVSPIQAALLDLWLGGRDDVCVVGDPAQTIYSFAGASADHLLHFGRKFSAQTSVTLVRNYRSTPQVVEVANTVMAAHLGEAAVRLRAVRPEGPKTTFAAHPDEVAEAHAVAETISAALAGGADPAEIAVLYRINAASENFEEALAERSIPFVVRGSERFFDRPEVRQAVTLLRGASRSQAPLSGVLVEDVASVFSAMGWSTTAPSGRGSVRDRWESLQALLGVAQELAATSPGVDLAGLVAELQRRQDAQHAPIASGVTLTTLHAAKGLEWSTVFLVGMHEGTLPIVYATTPAAVDEERRLLYVGVTRARDRLHVSWSATRSPGGRPSRGPSRFLDGLLGGDHTTSGPPHSKTSRRRRSKGAKMAACRMCSRPLTDPRERKLGRCLGCPSNYDEELHSTLREWRRQRAAAERVPAYCVFTDATLTALAEMVPSDFAALGRVPGIGAAKVEKYGAELLALCEAGSGSHPSLAPVTTSP